MKYWELVAREAIRDLVARYNSNGDSGRFDELIELFSADAVMEVEDRLFQGPDEIRSIFERARLRSQARPGRPLYLCHITGTHQIDLVEESRGKGRCYFFVLTSAGLDHWGKYLDEYRTVNGEWKFSRRQALTSGRTPGSLLTKGDLIS